MKPFTPPPSTYEQGDTNRSFRKAMGFFAKLEKAVVKLRALLPHSSRKSSHRVKEISQHFSSRFSSEDLRWIKEKQDQLRHQGTSADPPQKSTESQKSKSIKRLAKSKYPI